jgi:hypothetical protein
MPLPSKSDLRDWEMTVALLGHGNAHFSEYAPSLNQAKQVLIQKLKTRGWNIQPSQIYQTPPDQNKAQGYTDPIRTQ